MDNTFTIAALLFGNFPQLALRLLSSLANDLKRKMATESLVDIRLGLNNVGEHTFVAVQAFTELMCDHGCTVYWYVPRTASNQPAYKYPTMRRMIYGVVPVTADYFVWFDDDSVLVDNQLYFLMDLGGTLGKRKFVGIRYWREMTVPQLMWIKGRPWWHRKRVPDARVAFPAGSWWVGQTKFLTKWDYPFPELKQCGGDAMLGQLLAARLKPENIGWLPLVNDFVHHNCDDTLQPSTAPRRGISENEFAMDFVGHPLTTSHQDIDFDIIRHQQGRFCHARDFSRSHDPEVKFDLSDLVGGQGRQGPEARRQQHLSKIAGEY